MPTSTVTIGYTGHGESQSGSTSLTTDGSNLRGPIVLTNMQANVFVDMNIVLANLKRLCIFSDKAVLIETNNSSGGDEAITLVANSPYFWDADGYLPNPLETDITALYLSNLTTSNATVYIYPEVDGTPT